MKRTQNFHQNRIGRALLFILLWIQMVSYAQNPNEYEVYAIRFATEGRAPLSFAAEGASEKDSIVFCDMFWLLIGNGKHILVDAGYLRNNSADSDLWKSYIRPDSALQRMAIQANEITDIIITHPHNDHIGGIELFPLARIWMQKDDYDYFVGSAWQKNGIHDGFEPADVKKIVAKNLDGKLTLIKGDSIEIFPGIRAFIGSKHTWESQYLLVNTKTDRVIIASDNSWFYYNVEHLLPITHYLFDPAAYVRQLKRMRVLQPDISLIIPGHDPLVFSRFPKVAEDIVRIR
jgi:glyoxylase-like metal-dependent hydrolase (beta-lactamase superfamily II)